MKTSKILSITYQIIQALVILLVITWRYIKLDYIIYFVFGLSLIFINIITWVNILNNERSYKK